MPEDETNTGSDSLLPGAPSRSRLARHACARGQGRPAVFQRTSQPNPVEAESAGEPHPMSSERESKGMRGPARFADGAKGRVGASTGNAVKDFRSAVSELQATPHP